MQLSECVDVAAGPVCVSVRVQDEAAVQGLHAALVGLSRVEEVHCRRYGNHWLLTACGAATHNPEPLLLAVAGLVDQFGPLVAEVTDVRRGASLLPEDSRGYRVSPRFRVVADRALSAGDTIVLGASQVFGTGAHPSTRLTVQAMEELTAAEELFPARVLDIGTGSGILALVAARLGAETVLGIDICQEAVAVARGNVQDNGFARQVRIEATPLAEVTGEYDLVLVNVTASVLLRLAAAVVARLRRGGRLIVAGMQGRQSGEIEALLGQYGLTVCSRYGEGKWGCLTLRLPASGRGTAA